MERFWVRYHQALFFILLLVGFMAPLSNLYANLILLLALFFVTPANLALFGARPWLCLLIALGYASSLWSTRPIPVTLVHVLMYATDAWLGLVLVRQFNAKQILRLTFWSLFVCCVIQFLALSFLPDISYGHRARWRGLMLHKNFLGHLAALAVIVAAAMPAGLVRVSSRLALAGLGFVLLIGADSTESLLASAICLPLLALKVGTRSTKNLAVLPIFLLLGLVAKYWVPFVNMLGKSTTLTYRVAIWESSLRCAAEFPWWGYGCGRLRLLWFPSIGHAHNGMLSILLQLGLVGLFLLLLDLASALVAWLIERKGRRRLAERAALAYLAVFAFFNLTEPVPPLPGHSTWLVLYVAATQALLTGQVGRESATELRRKEPGENTDPSTPGGKIDPCSG